MTGGHLGRLSAVKLLDRHAPEDPVLAEIRLPRHFDFALGAVAAAAIAVAMVGSLVMADGDDRINLLLAALVALPWLVWIGRGCHPPGVAAPLVLLPHAAVAVVDGVTVDGTVGFAPQFLLYLCLLRLVGCVSAPQRQATLLIAATYVVIVSRGVVSPEPATTLAPWILALTFAVAAVAGVRVGALSLARAQQAAAEQEALDERHRIARDVHDVVADTLAATMRHVAAARRAVDRAAVDEAVAALEEAEHEGRASLGDIRRTIRLLRSDGEAPHGAEIVL